MVPKEQSLLTRINSPKDLKELPEELLPAVCQELRDFIIDTLSCNPGHFGASLGVVELTVALHYILDTPYDKLVWDVGHQAYGHKILTGRRDVFATNRKLGGISGFPNIFESEYDAFGVGHSSTSISAALGMATAARLKGEKNRHVVAVIGDGAMTGGMAFEALNNMACANADMLVILNDNNMAIDPAVGSFSEYLVDISTSRAYNKIRSQMTRALEKIRPSTRDSRDLITRITTSIKGLVSNQNNIFEGLNVRYFGPVDGHDIGYLTQVLRDLINIPGPKLLHVITKKGKGFKLAEENQTEWHAVGAAFDKVTGAKTEPSSVSQSPMKFQDVFGHTIIELARSNDKIVGITPAMPSGCSMNLMMEVMPDRTFDVGIAEQHAVTFSAGLAIAGYTPFCNIYSTFMQRAYDQVIHDVAIQNLDVVFCLDRGGLVGADGATHHGVYDLAFFRCIPNMIISAPMDESELRNLMFTAQIPGKGPFVIRYPRGNGSLQEWCTPFSEIPIGTGRVLTEGKDLAFITIGPLGVKVGQVVEKLGEMGHSPSHYDLRFVKPLDEKLLHDIFGKHKKIITLEDGAIMGGMGSAVMEFMAEHGYTAQIQRMGIPDRFIEHGTQTELYKECGFDKQSILDTAIAMLK